MSECERSDKHCERCAELKRELAEVTEGFRQVSDAFLAQAQQSPTTQSSTAAQECRTANAHDLYLVSTAWFKYVREEISADVLFAFMKEAAENYRDRFNGLAPSATAFTSAQMIAFALWWHSPKSERAMREDCGERALREWREQSDISREGKS